MSSWLEDVITGLENLNGIASLEEIYKELKAIRLGSHPKSFNAIIRKTLECYSSDSNAFQGKGDLFYSVEGIGGGVWGLRSALEHTPIAADVNLPNGSNQPARQQQETYRILRDTSLARMLKKLHNDQCQLCGHSIQLSNGTRYSEAHHIRPLGTPHNGPDTAENIIVLCPNHHVMLDYGVVELDFRMIMSNPKHKIGTTFLDYHNEVICGSSTNI